LEALYREEIAPELGSIERLLEKSRKSAGKTLIENSGITVLSLSAALFSSGASTLFSGAASILGGGHFAKTMVPALRERISVPDEARDKELFFAWDLKRKL
jgi:hypothetical protein